jgi:diketogulonate reductase-like aldo/keto reductase
MEFAKTTKLNNGEEIPLSGFGTYAMQGLAETVYESIKKGLRCIDTAEFYKNEKEIGEGIKKAIEENIITRKELYIITKIWPTSKHIPEETLLNQLNDLNLTYVDLYLDHWPSQINEVDGKIIKTPMHILWRNMEDLVRKGLTKSIGVSNYNIQSLNNLLSFCEIKPVLNQVEFHPYFYQKELLSFCRNNDILLMAYNSLCKGVYTQRDIHKEKNLNLLEEKIVKELSEKYNRTPGQIVLNWAIYQNVIVIPASSKSDRVKENIESFNFRLSEEDFEMLCKLDIGYRFIIGKIGPNQDGSFY